MFQLMIGKGSLAGTRWIAAWLCLAPWIPAQAEEPQSPPTSRYTTEAPTVQVPQPYMRVEQGEEGRMSLQIALREFLPEAGNHPAIWLVAVSHVGETNYYRELEAFLRRRSLVLFEGVGFDKESFRRRQKERQTDPGVTDGDATLQTLLAQSLDLAFQLDAIDYDQDRFQNSDMTVGEVERLMIRRVEEGALDRNGGINPEFLALMAAMEGTSWLGTFLHVGVKLLGTSPKLKAMTRLMLIEVLGGVRGDLSRMQGLPPDVRELLRVLIHARNDVVLRDVKAALARLDPASSIAVFYGAAHMDDMERRVRSELAYRPGQERWMTALTVDPARAGLSEAEINTIRALIEMQMRMLQGREAAP